MRNIRDVEMPILPERILKTCRLYEFIILGKQTSQRVKGPARQEHRTYLVYLKKK